MYIDTVVASGLAIVILCCVMFTYVGMYAYKHIKQDTENFENTKKRK